MARPSGSPALGALAALLLTATLLALSGCPEQSFQALEPAFTISWPEEQGFVPGDAANSVFQFGQVTTGSFADIPVAIANPGNAALELCSLHYAAATFDGDGAVSNAIILEADPELSTSPLPDFGPFPAGGSTTFLLRYTPLSDGGVNASTHFVVQHELNGGCASGALPGLYVPVVGEGFGEPVPDIQAKPAQIDFGTTILDFEPPPQSVLVSNVGPGILNTGAVTLTDPTHFTLQADTVSATSFATGELGQLTVRFTPQFQGTHAAALLVDSNDPDEDPLSIPLFGVANPEEIKDPPGDDDDTADDDDDTADDDDSTPPPSGFPVAICGSTIIANPQEVVTFQSFSFHTGGFAETLALQYAWTLTTPPGSATTLSNANTSAATTTPFVDLVGTYIGHLTVTDSAGQTDSCDQNVEVLPQENFRVELFWDAEDDFDLHLLEANDGSGNQGQPWSDGDCYFGNCVGLGRDWGVSGDVYDNPYLDLDDIGGFGPENTNITDPALSPYDGWYQVMVHDYTGSTDDNYGVTNGTLNVYLNGVLAGTYTFSMSDDGDEYYVVQIEWPSGQIQPCSGLGGCP